MPAQLFFWFFCVLFALGSCEKPIGFCEKPKPLRVSQSRQAEPFTGIHLNTKAQVYVQQGVSNTIEVIAPSNLLDLIETTVTDEVLYISYNGHCVHKKSDLVIRITAPVISKLGVSGNGTIHASDKLLSNTMHLSSSGEGNIELANLITDYCNIVNTGSGSIWVSGEGSAANAFIEISGSGSVYTTNFSADYVHATLSGSGDAAVNATQLLQVHLSGSGNLHFVGNPDKIISITGTGKVTPE